MRIQWYGQSAFDLAGRVFIDPFHDVSGLEARGWQFDYPAIEGVEPELLLVTHEHRDHNGVEAIGGSPAVLRSTAGTHESPVGEVIGVASEHDEVAGTQRGPNTIFVFTLGDLRIAHFGDFGQVELRDAQLDAIGQVDLVFVPVGDGPTIGAAQARAVVEQLGARWAVPMHYRTPRISFLETADAFLELFDDVVRLDSPAFDTADLPEGPVAVVPAVP
jgi:L-ascorbate metabolism protein UlaG (beta-lactamase superfamily)